MLSMNVIETTQMEWASLIVSVPKKDGALGFCLDY